MSDRQHLVELINNTLPQTQCTQCGYNGCAPYAHAIVFDNAPINQCPPGGQTGIVELARITKCAVSLAVRFTLSCIDVTAQDPCAAWYGVEFEKALPLLCDAARALPEN